MKKFTIEKGRYGKKLVLCSRLTETIVNYCIENDIGELELNWAKGFKAENLSLIKSLTQLLRLEICDYTIEDISEIHFLTGLKELNISTYCKTKINLNSFQELEELSLFWRKGITGFDNLKKLKKLFLYKYNPPSKDLTGLGNIKTLEYISLKAPIIKAVGNVKNLEHLNFLGIYAAVKLADIDGLTEFKNLKHLELDTCRKIKDMKIIGQMNSLEKLSISNCGNIESLKPISNLANLSELRFAESTNVIDGDIEILKKLPKLAKIVFQNREHYNQKMDDFAKKEQPYDFTAE